MSQFSKYAKKMDAIAREAFKEYRDAQERLDRANERAKQFPSTGGITHAEYRAESARAQADREDAAAAVERVRRKMQGEYQRQIADIRSQLVAEVSEAYAVDPAQIDEKTLALLQSGIMGVADYERMMQNAIRQGNITMLKLTCKAAADAADKRVENPLHGNDDRAKQLRALSLTGDQYDGSAVVDSFDALSYIFIRCANNPAMMPDWETMSGDIVRGF